MGNKKLCRELNELREDVKSLEKRLGDRMRSIEDKVGYRPGNMWLSMDSPECSWEWDSEGTGIFKELGLLLKHFGLEYKESGNLPARIIKIKKGKK